MILRSIDIQKRMLFFNRKMLLLGFLFHWLWDENDKVYLSFEICHIKCFLGENNNLDAIFLLCLKKIHMSKLHGREAIMWTHYQDHWTLHNSLHCAYSLWSLWGDSLCFLWWCSLFHPFHRWFQPFHMAIFFERKVSNITSIQKFLY